MTDWRAYAGSLANEYDLPYFVPQIQAESGFNPNARSPAGATGIAQIMPATARGWKVDPTKPGPSLRAAAQAMRRYYDQYGNWEDALEAYNAGGGNVIRGPGIKYDETRAYVAKILGSNPQATTGAGASFDPSNPSNQPFGVTLSDQDVKKIKRWEIKSQDALQEGRIVDLPPALMAKIIAAGRAEAPREGAGGHDGHGHGGAPGAPPGPLPAGGKFMQGGAGGNWGGSAPIAMQLAALTGLPITSQKRERQMTASGNPSDHWTGLTSSYAVDLGTSGAAGDAAFAKLMRQLGQPNAKPGQWLNIPYNGYRIQVGWRTPGHYDHIHVGVRPA